MTISSTFHLHSLQQNNHHHQINKKIYKYLSTPQHLSNPQCQSKGIIQILKKKKIPSFILEGLKKRRKTYGQQLDRTLVKREGNLQEMRRYATDQQSEVATLCSSLKKGPSSSKFFFPQKLQRKPTTYSLNQQQQTCSMTFPEIQQQQKYMQQKSVKQKKKQNKNKKSSKKPIKKQSHFYIYNNYINDIQTTL